MQRLDRFLGWYPAYTYETVLRMPFHRYISACRAKNPDAFPEHFGRMLAQDALSEAEHILELYQRNRAQGRGIKPPPETEAGDA